MFNKQEVFTCIYILMVYTYQGFHTQTCMLNGANESMELTDSIKKIIHQFLEPPPPHSETGCRLVRG